MISRYFLILLLLIGAKTMAQVPKMVDQINGELLIPNFKNRVKSELVDAINGIYVGRYGCVSERQEGYCTSATLELRSYFGYNWVPKGESEVDAQIYQDIMFLICGEGLSSGILFGGNKYSVDLAYYFDNEGDLYLKMWVTFSIRETAGTNLTLDLVTKAGNFDKCGDYRAKIEYFDPFGVSLFPEQEIPLEFSSSVGDGSLDFMTLSIPIPSGEREYVKLDSAFMLDEWGNLVVDSLDNIEYRYFNDTIRSDRISVQIEILTTCKGFFLFQWTGLINIKPNQDIRILRSLHKNFHYEED